MAKTSGHRKSVESKSEPKANGKPAQSSRLSIPKRVDGPSPSNFAFEWKPKQDGSGEVLFAYEGPLAKRENVVAHVGTWREGGEPWSGQQEVSLRRESPGRFVGALAVSAGTPLRAVEIALRHGDSWDNGGRAPLGYYEWRLGENQVAVV